MPGCLDGPIRGVCGGGMRGIEAEWEVWKLWEDYGGILCHRQESGKRLIPKVPQSWEKLRKETLV